MITNKTKNGAVRITLSLTYSEALLIICLQEKGNFRNFLKKCTDEAKLLEPYSTKQIPHRRNGE